MTVALIFRDPQRHIDPINLRWRAVVIMVNVQSLDSASSDPLDGCTLDDVVEGSGAVFEAKFMLLPWSFSEECCLGPFSEDEEVAAEKQRHTWIYIVFLDLCGFRKRTPSPPPLSSMKPIPAASRARRIAASFASVTRTSPSTTSALRMVATPTFEARAKSRAVHRISARAARI